MPVAALRLIEYRTEDGPILSLKVSPEVAEALKGEGARLKEVTFTDLGDGRFELDNGTVRRRVSQRKTPKGYPWEGPRHQFTRIIGEGRTWNEVPSPGDFCGWADLAPGEYCLCCERSGRDDEIPMPSAADLAKRGISRAYRKGKLRGGVG